MKLTNYEWLRAGRVGTLCWIVVGLLGIALAPAMRAQGVSTTTVQGTVYLANGQPGAGTLVVSWPAFTTAAGQAVAADSTTIAIPEDGFVSVNLAPNVGALPAGQYYTAVFYMIDGSVHTQYWQVPAAAQASLASVETQVMPAAQAVQAVSKSYVDEAVAALTGSLLTASGGTLTGPLTLCCDPTEELQAATKHYVDTQVATAVPLAGGNMTGPLGTPAVNGVEAPAVGSAQTTLQTAMNAAGTNGAMEIPPTYAGTDTFTNTNGVKVTDLRTSVAQQTERSVKEFGAVCNGTTDDTNALQAAINYANAHNVALTIPEGTCKTRTLNWHGESIGGLGKQVSALMGFPGQDVLASTADSPNLLQYTRLHDLTIYVDQSVDESCTAAEGRAAAGSCQVSRPIETNSIFSAGGNGLTNAVGTGAAYSVGNCAIAMPAATGAGGNGLRVAEIENLEIATTGTDPMAATYPGAHSTHTCGMYLAQWPQWSEFRNIDIRGLNTGVAIPALPVTTPAGLNADSNRWQNVTIQATHAFTAAAGSNNVLDNVVGTVGNSSATAEPPTGLVLDLSGTQQGWTVRNAVVLPTWNVVEPALTVTAAGGAVTAVAIGTEHGLGWDPYGTSVPVTFSGSCTATATATVASNGSISGVTVIAGGVGCSATTTASLNEPGTWDTDAPVNLIGGQDMTLFAGNLLKGNGGYTVWNAASSASYGTQLDGGGGNLPGGGSYAALVANSQLGSTLLADLFPGSNFGAKLQACVNAVSASYGGTCDARNFTGSLAMTSNLTISTGNTTVLLPCATISTAYQIVVTAGTRNVMLRGCALRGGSSASGSQGGTAFAYSGSGAMVQVGDPTYATDTLGFHLDNVVINTTSSTSASAKGVIAYRTQELDLESLYLLGNGNQTAITLDGTGNYTGGTFLDNEIDGFQTAINAIGHQAANPATTDWMNASTFVRVHIDCPTSGGSPVSGTIGINLQQGDGNTFTGGDVEGCATALHLGSNAQNNTIVGLRNENSTSQVVADAGSAYNSWMTGGTMFAGELTDNGARNSFLDTFHRSFNGLNGDWYGSQQDATVTNHYRLGIGTGNERGLLDEYQTDFGYRWTTGLSDATGGQQFYQILDQLNNVYRLDIGQYQSATANAITNVILNNNGCYTSSTAPTIGFTGGGGTGAAATATMYAITTGTSCVGGYGVASVTMTNNGTGYTTQPTVTWTGSNQTAAPNAVAEIAVAGGTNNQTAINAAGTGAIVLNGSNNAGTGGVVIGSGGASETTVATISNAGNAQFNGTLQVNGTSQSAGTMTVRNSTDAEVDYYLWPGLTTTQKGSFTYKDWNGNSQWYLVKDASNNWEVNSAVGGLDSFKAYQSTNSGDTYIDSSNSTGHIRLNYETGSGVETDIYSGGSSNLVAAFLGTTSIKFPGLAAGSGHYCLQVDDSGYLTNTGTACGSGASSTGVINTGSTNQIAYFTTDGAVVGGETSVPVAAGGTGATTAAGAVSNLLPGVSSDGSNGIVVTGNTAAESATAETIGGFRYASQYQTGAGNNGIANASSGATNQTVIADPSYGTTETPSTTSLSTSPFALEDDRQSMKSLYYHNPGNNVTYGHLWNWPYDGWYSWAGETVSALFDGVSANGTAATMNNTFASTRPGWTLGNNNISGGGQGWYSTTNLTLSNQSNSAGLDEGMSIVGNKYGLGDFSLFNCEILNTHNGAISASDEGTKCYDAYVFEDTGTYTGTCSSGCATGSTSIKTTVVTDNNSQGVGQYVIDTSNTPVQGKFTNIVSGLGGGSAVTVSVSSGAVTESVAWGSVTAAVGTPLNASSPYSTSETFTIAIAGGTGGSGGQYDTTHLACWAGNYHDCAVPSAVGSVSGGTQSVTMPLRRPHAAGSYLFQGGMAGYGFEATSFTENPNGQPLRYLFDVVGATSSTTLQVGEYEVQTYHYVPITNNDYGCFNVSSGVTNGGSGSTITAVWSSSYCAISIGTLPYHFTNGTFYFSGLSDSSLNNVACTNVAFQSNQTTFTCTISGLSGSHTDTTGGTASLGANSFKLWPMAETLDVQNETLSPPQMDGTLQLEPNIIPFQSGDTIEQPHHVAQEMSGSTTSMSSYDPYFTTGIVGVTAQMKGAGVIGGGTLASNGFFNAINSNPDAMYIGSGGTLTPPNGILIAGPYAYGLSFTDGPVTGYPLINVYPNSVQMNDPNYCFDVWQVYGLSSADLEQECPNTGNLFIDAAGSLNLYSGTSTVNLRYSALQINGNTVIPTTVTGYHGNASGVSVPLAVNWTNSAGALLCDDGNGNITTSGCSSGGSGGGGGSLTTQTNGSNNTSQTGINFITSTTNLVGLTATPFNPATTSEKFEITGTYTGNVNYSQLVGTPPTWNQNTTGTAGNVTATSNSTLATLSSLSLPYSQLSGTVPIWNQNTTGTAANVTATSNSTLTTLPSLSLPYSQITGGPSGSGGGTVTYTSSQTASSSDSGKLVVMNCSAACTYTLPATQPSTTWSVHITTQGSTNAMIALGGSDTFNGGSSVPVLSQYTVMPIFANSATSTDYRGSAPLVAGTNISISPASNGITINNTYTLPTATTSALGGVKPDNATILNSSGAISEAPNYFYQGPWTGTSALGLAVASRIDGWGFTVPAPVIFSNIYGISNAVDTTGTDYYSLTILCGQGQSGGSCTGGVSQGAIICSPSAGSNMPAADSLFTSSCSQGTVELYPENYYVMLFTGNATVGKLMGTAANSVVGSYFSINIGGCSSSSGVVSGTCTLTGVGTAVVYSTVPPSFSLH